MRLQCAKCEWWFDDEFRDTYCPHEAFPANDGRNNFAKHHEAYLVPPTTVRLSVALAEANATPLMVQRALDGYYDDFKSPLATPLMALVEEARRQGLTDIVERVKAGEFDSTREESDAWMSGPEGSEAMRELRGYR